MPLEWMQTSHKPSSLVPSSMKITAMNEQTIVVSSVTPKIETKQMKDKHKKSQDLPLDWTQMSRKKSSDDCDLDDCCVNGSSTSCRRRVTEDMLFHASDNNTTVLEGQAIFCIPELDSAWFQGYFIVRGSKPIGLLATIETDIDDCLKCADGGYRQLSLQLCRRNNQDADAAESAGIGRAEATTTERTPIIIPPPIIFPNIEWTGGDMMTLRGNQVVFDTTKLLTGTKAMSVVEQFFGGIVRKLQESEGHASSQMLLELIPDVAIVMGSMKLAIPTDVRNLL